ncbi:CBS domain-containing protein [Candidatus Woesearchaeota archaeon]|nr:CBS domain-containing protein [Candidatus Woesearchaeota archaeon]
MLRFNTGVVVGDAMTLNVITIKPDDTIKTAAKKMAEEKIGSLVVKDKGRVVGIITDTDIVRKAVTGNIPTAKRKVKSVMSEKLYICTPDEDIFDALRAMRDYNVKHLPVTSGGELVGLITLKDILKIEPDLFEILVDKLDLRETERKPIQR